MVRLKWPAVFGFAIGLLVGLAGAGAMVGSKSTEIVKSGSAEPGAFELPKPDFASKSKPNKDSTPNTAFANLPFTEDDARATEEMNERQQRGEYILKFERPTTKKFIEKDFAEIVAAGMSAQSGAYDQLFTKLGVRSEDGELIKQHLGQIHKASLQAEISIQQLLHARADFKDRLQQLMAPENYAKYFEFEQQKPALREFEAFQVFLSEQGQPNVAAEDVENYVQAISKAKAFSRTGWHGPFDDLPQPAIGSDMVLRQLGEQAENLRARSLSALNEASANGIPESSVFWLRAYFQQQINKKESTAESIRLSGSR